MYFDTGSADDVVSGDLSGVLQFAQSLAETLASTIETGVVRVLFSDMGAMAMAQSRWDSEVESVKLDYLPPIVALMAPTLSHQEQLKNILADSAYLVVVAPRQLELPAILQLCEDMESAGTDLPMIIINP